MRSWWAGCFLALLIHAPATAGQGLVVGLSADELLGCSPEPTAMTQLNGKSIYEFVLTSDVSGVLPAVNVQPLGQSQFGCRATVEIENGKVVAASLQKLGRSPLACFVCYNLFSECKYIRR
jgi:hypothetical protein